MSTPNWSDGLVAFVKRDCPTCVLVQPALRQLAESTSLVIVTQDDPTFPDGLEAVDDGELEMSWRSGIETVPTLIRFAGGVEQGRAEGWVRDEWQALSGIAELAPELPPYRPGCGSLSVDPDRRIDLAVRFDRERLRARRIELAPLEDEMEAAFERGWSDGLPVVPPTERRVMRMLEGTTRAPQEVVVVIPPDMVECTVEKIAINAVLAGCKPEYLPVVIAAVEAACTDEFNAHGLLATTMSAGPVIVVNGPIRRLLGMNSGMNVFGQGNRANNTIGRALQLVIRNVGGGRPGEIDRATFGNPGKIAFCFAEDEETSPWTPLNVDLGAAAGTSTVTLFPGEGPRTIVDQLARDPESLARTFAACLRTLHHPKLVMAFDCILAVGPEHARVFAEGGWSKQKLIERLGELLQTSGEDLVHGAGGMAEGLPEHFRGATITKFRSSGLLVVHCGGRAGLFSAMIGGWVNGSIGSQPVMREVRA